MSDVTARFEPVGDYMRLTLTFTGGAAGGSYRLTRNEALYIGTALEYTGTDYEGSSTILNETRYDYYLRYVIKSEITLVASENEALHNLDVNDVKTDYAPGEAPRATATIPAADADKYEIVQCAISEAKDYCDEGADLLIATTVAPEGLTCPYVSGVPFMTGMNRVAAEKAVLDVMAQ